MTDQPLTYEQWLGDNATGYSDDCRKCASCLAVAMNPEQVERYKRYLSELPKPSRYEPEPD